MVHFARADFGGEQGEQKVISRMRIDIVSDVVCPWCFVGKRRLEKALAERPDLEVEIFWQPFQLNPDMPEEGMDHREYYLKKFGGEERVEALTTMMSEAGASEGIAFDFKNIPRAPNTLAAHRLVHWAGPMDLQDAVVEALFKAYFQEGRDVGDHPTLIEIGAAAGMDADILTGLYKEGSDVDVVTEAVKTGQEMGISGVPCFIIDWKFAVQGAQPPEQLLQVIDRALRAATEAAEAAAAESAAETSGKAPAS